MQRAVAATLAAAVRQAAVQQTTAAARHASSSAGILSEAAGKLGTPGRSAVAGVRCVVFGNTGFLGRYVVNKLGQIGTQVILPYRGDEHDIRHMKLMGDLGRIVPTEVDTRSPDSLREVLDGADVVVNLIGINKETRNWSFDATHIHLAGAIAEAAADAGVERLVHVSHMSADARSMSSFLRSKGEGEAAVRRAFPKAVVVKPASMVGIEDQLLNKYGELAGNFSLLPIATGDAIIRPVLVTDVAAGIVRAIDEPHAEGQDYYFGGPAGMTRRELFNYIFRLIRVEPRFVNVPLGFMSSVGSLIEKLPNAILTKDQVLVDSISQIIPEGAKTLADLNVRTSPIEPIALQILRRFRPARMWSDPMSADDQHIVLPTAIAASAPTSAPIRRQ